MTRFTPTEAYPYNRDNRAERDFRDGTELTVKRIIRPHLADWLQRQGWREETIALIDKCKVDKFTCGQFEVQVIDSVPDFGRSKLRTV